jgi:hypothetical protein
MSCSRQDKIVLSTEAAPSYSFDEVQNSIAQVYAGLVTEESIKKPKMVVSLFYQSFSDLWFRFRVFNIDFYDIESHKLLLRAGQYGDNPFINKMKVIDRTFEEIKNRFFPETLANK